MNGIGEVALFTDDVVAAGSFYRRLLGTEPVAEVLRESGIVPTEAGR